MALVLILLLQAVAPAKPTQTRETPPTFVVQVVDPAWLPVPGAEVIVQTKSGKGPAQTMRTGKDGFAQFWLPAEAEYIIEAKESGFRSTRLKGVFIGKESPLFPTAYVQIRLKLSPSSIAP